jgi:enamine deaminase RidA (YjgF/YER057c/UK114 family)
MSYEAKLKEMGYTLEPLKDLNAGRLMLARRTGNLIYTSGQTPNWEGRQIYGQVGKDLTVEEGYEAARLATLNCLRAVKTLAGSLDNVVQVVKVFGMVNVAPGFVNTPAVIHGCSDFLIELFGDAGRPARSAIGLTVPMNYAVEIEMIVEVK